MRRDVFQGISDPTRREIILLLNKNNLTLNSIAENFSISRPAVSKHIRILEECGLVNIKQKGRERLCRINPKPLKEVYNWLEHFNNLWDEKLNSLKNFLENNNE